MLTATIRASSIVVNSEYSTLSPATSQFKHTINTRLEEQQTRSSAIAEGPRDALCQLKSAAHLYEKFHFKKLAIVNDLEGHLSPSELPLFDGSYFLLVVCSYHVSVLHRFRYITTLTVHVTVCNREKSSNFDQTVQNCKLLAISDSYIHRPNLVNGCYICQCMGVRSVLDSNNLE